MKLLNRGPSPKYCQLAKCRVMPGHATRELDSFIVAYKSILEESKGFEIILSDGDVRLLAELCAKYLAPLANGGEDDLGRLSGIEGLVSTAMDPSGTRRLDDRAAETRRNLQRIRSEALRSAMEREARVRSESNIIGPDGNPVAREETMARDSDVEVDKAEVHAEMSTDLKSVIENNLAVMRTASGKPIRNDPKSVVAKPGGTPVPTDPKYYQSMNRTVPPGQPELPK